MCVHVSQDLLHVFIREELYPVLLEGIPASKLAVPCNFRDNYDVYRAEVLYRESTGGLSNMYRCENLTINLSYYPYW
jgi:hypothetical protein